MTINKHEFNDESLSDETYLAAYLVRLGFRSCSMK